LKEVVAEQALNCGCSKKHDRGWGRPNMRLPASEKLEIIYLVEQSHLPARRTLEMLGIKPSTFYRCYDRFRSGGPEATQDKPSKPDRVWNRIPDDAVAELETLLRQSARTMVTVSGGDELFSGYTRYAFADEDLEQADTVSASAAPRLDRAAMAVSLETKVPMLDHRLVEFAMSLPLGILRAGGKTKWLLSGSCFISLFQRS
jgi:hypothetical protein